MFEKLISTHSILGRGWSHGLIRTLLGAPAKLGRNSYFYNSGVMKLYQWDRVIAAESDPRWIAHQATRRHRVQAGIAAARIKTRQRS